MTLLAQHCAQGLDRAQLYERSLAAVRARDDFLSVAGHELRTPLATLILQTEALLAAAANAPETLPERARPMLRSVRRLSKLAEELLDVSRMRAGRLSIERESLELTSLVREAVARALEAMPRAPAVRVHAPEPIIGRWDPQRLEQVVTNLLGNAVKYGGGQPVDVQVRCAPSRAELVVRDQGIGISVVEQTRIFERFSRVVERRDYAGLGLGLWIVRQIVLAHGGEISVRSAPGQGAEFTVSLPMGEGL
jgi:signal transduction histidine kinase